MLERSPTDGGRRIMDVVIYALPIIATILFVIFGRLYTAPHKQAAIWLLFFPGTLALLIALCLFWQKSVTFEIENPPFAVAIETALVGADRGTQVFAEYNTTYLASVEFILLIRLRNLQSVPTTISDLTVDVELEKARWIFPPRWLHTTSIPEQMRLVWVNPPPNPSFTMALDGPRLETILKNASLQPNQTVRGFVLLDVPKQYVSATHPPIFRLLVKDTAGKKVVVVDPGSQGGNLSPGIGIKTLEEVDISKHTVVHLADSSN